MATRTHLRLVTDEAPTWNWRSDIDPRVSHFFPAGLEDDWDRDCAWRWLTREAKARLYLEVLGDERLTNAEIFVRVRAVRGPIEPCPGTLQAVAAQTNALHRKGRLARIDEPLLDGKTKFYYCRPSIVAGLSDEVRALERAIEAVVTS